MFVPSPYCHSEARSAEESAVFDRLSADGCPIQARFWLGCDSTTVDTVVLISNHVLNLSPSSKLTSQKKRFRQRPFSAKLERSKIFVPESLRNNRSGFNPQAQLV